MWRIPQMSAFVAHYSYMLCTTVTSRLLEARVAYSRTSWKVDSANFACTEFSEVREFGFLRS